MLRSVFVSMLGLCEPCSSALLLSAIRIMIEHVCKAACKTSKSKADEGAIERSC